MPQLRHDGCGWPRECARRGWTFLEESAMFGSVNKNILHYGGYE